MENMTFIHYGHKHFDKDLFKPIRNGHLISKPFGGLWASPTRCNRSWKDWCENETFRDCKEEDSFIFKLKPGSRVLTLRHPKELNHLPKFGSFNFTYFIGQNSLDFEQLSLSYDAILVYIGELYYELYGWDCDSILVMNPDCVEEV